MSPHPMDDFMKWMHLNKQDLIVLPLIIVFGWTVALLSIVAYVRRKRKTSKD